MPSPSVKDILDFGALPDDVQQLAQRALTGGTDVDVQLLAKAYRLGWEACADEISAPFLSDREAEGAVKGLLVPERAL